MRLAQRPGMSLRHLLLPLLVVCVACGPDDGKTSSDSSSGSTEPATTDPTGSTGSTDPTSSSDPTAATDTGSSTAELPTTSDGSSTGEPKPDPDFVRECQPGDFICEDWGCERGDVVELSECYKPCTPSVIGEPDDECDEPERPFCSQVGQAFGGDFDCNGCAHICVSEAYDQCGQSIDSCP